MNGGHERRIETHEVTALQVDILPSSGLNQIAQAISESEFDFDYLEWRVQTEYRRQGRKQLPAEENTAGLLAELHVASVLKSFPSEYIDTAPIADSDYSQGILFDQSRNGNVVFRSPESADPLLEIDGCIKVNNLLVPYDVKTSVERTQIFSAMDPARINKVVGYLQRLDPGQQFGYLVVAPDEAFNPPNLQRFLQEDLTQQTFSDRFRMQGGTTATLPASSAELRTAARKIHSNLQISRRRAA